VLGINICFYDKNDPKCIEPIFVAANIQCRTVLIRRERSREAEILDTFSSSGVRGELTFNDGEC
jgi:hypothetical protein